MANAASDKEYEQHPVINSHFQIERERSIVHIQLGFELLLQNGDIEENDTSTTLGRTTGYEPSSSSFYTITISSS
jgi:hypothetical protein